MKKCFAALLAACLLLSACSVTQAPEVTTQPPTTTTAPLVIDFAPMYAQLAQDYPALVTYRFSKAYDAGLSGSFPGISDLLKAALDASGEKIRHWNRMTEDLPTQ